MLDMFFSAKEYKSWDEACRHGTGYASPAIFEKVYRSAIQVRKNEAVYERDSVLFKKIQYSWPVLSALMCAAAMNDGRLNVVDFGGALGTSYFQNKKFLGLLKECRWNVVEQAHFVRVGKREFEDGILKFYFDLDVCARENDVQVMLFSGVLQYLEDPFVILEKAKSLPLKFIVIDRTPFHKGDEDKIVLQRVSRSIYPASYPSWIFSKRKFENFLRNDVILEKFDGFKERLTPYTTYRGYIVQTKSER